MIEPTTVPNPAATPEPINDGCLYFTKVVLSTVNGQIEVETSAHDTVAFLASYGVTDPSKPAFTVLCKTHWINVFAHQDHEAKTLMFAPGDWCSGCKAILAMPSVAPPLPTTVLVGAGAPVIVPAGVQVQLEHVQQGNGQQTATAVVLPVVSGADLDAIMGNYMIAKAEAVRLTEELEAAKVKVAQCLAPLIERGIKKLNWAGNKYTIVQKQNQLPYLRTGEK